MGGHGGLNILPQKSWHVYNRDARSKVERDEAKAAEEEEQEDVQNYQRKLETVSRTAEDEEQARQRHEDEEREYRRQLLIQRASGGASAAAVASTSGPPVKLLSSKPEQAYSTNLPVTLNASAPEAPLVSHINFWSEDEARMKAQHPEVLAEKRDEALNRGKQDFYTTDAKFDEKFKLGYGLTGSKPWYASAPSDKEGVEPQPLNTVKISYEGQKHKLESAPAGSQLQSKRQKKRQGQSSSSISSSSSSSSSDSDGTSSSSSSSSSSSADDNKKRKGHRKSKKRSRHEVGSKGAHGKSGGSKRRRGHKEEKKISKRKDKNTHAKAGARVMSLAQLREERAQREVQERARERQLLLGMKPAMEPNGYNSAFGYGAALAASKKSFPRR